MSFTKITHLQSEALFVFHQFVAAVRTQHWTNGVELTPKDYDGEPVDFCRRESTVWQGNRNGLHQKLTVKFVYSSDDGWFVQAIVFSGKQLEEEWSQAFRISGRDNDLFIPCKLKHGWYPEDYSTEEHDQIREKFFGH
jgi:hypothetical protein